MSVGAVGGIGGGMSAGGMLGAGGAAPLNFGGLNGALDSHNGMAGLSSIQLQQLTELLDGFSSAEILMALMLMAASQKKKSDDDSSGAIAILAGMAMARQLGQSCACPLGGVGLGVSGATSSGACNVLA